MKKILVGLMVMAATIGFSAALVSAQVVSTCTDTNGNPITCPSNGMTPPEPTGWIVVPDGVDGCPTWFPAGCALPPSVQQQLGL